MRSPLSGLGFRALVQRDGNGWATRTVRLLVLDARPNGAEVLQSDGTWVSISEGSALPDDVGIVLPDEAVEAIAQAISEYQGYAGHAETETRVLREWLAVERARVDRSLEQRP